MSLCRPNSMTKANAQIDIEIYQKFETVSHRTCQLLLPAYCVRKTLTPRSLLMGLYESFKNTELNNRRLLRKRKVNNRTLNACIQLNTSLNSK